MKNKPSDSQFYNQIITLLHIAKDEVLLTVNKKMVSAYYEIGKMIIEKEQQGEDRAKYGKHLLNGLSNVLMKEFGKGFSVTNIQQIVKYTLPEENEQIFASKYKTVLRQKKNLQLY